MLKKTLIWLIKAFVAGLLALSVVSSISFFYYNLPTHSTNKTGATDYFLFKNHVSFGATEGFASTKTDENGFVNTFPEKKDQIDVLIMGSSHTESLNVNADENFTYLLNKKFKENGQDRFAYSIGVSGHDFIRCLKNFDNAVKTYSPKEYIVIETSVIEFSEESLAKLESGTYGNLESYDSGLVYYLQKIDFFRLAYAQITNFIEKDQKNNNNKKKDSDKVSDTAEEDLTEYERLIEAAIGKISKTAEENGCRIIIIYTPQTDVDYYGNIIKKEYNSKQKAFINICKKYNVACIDMLPSYVTMYEEIRYLPQGFANIAIGKGHTNKYGHSCIAEELYKTVTE